MRFDSWIEKEDPKTLAKKLHVDASTISNWKTGKSFPRPHHLLDIYKESRGAVGFETIVRHFLARQKKLI